MDSKFYIELVKMVREQLETVIEQYSSDDPINFWELLGNVESLEEAKQYIKETGEDDILPYVTINTSSGPIDARVYCIQDSKIIAIQDSSTTDYAFEYFDLSSVDSELGLALLLESIEEIIWKKHS